MADEQLNQDAAAPETPPTEPSYQEIHDTPMRELAQPEPETPPVPEPTPEPEPQPDPVPEPVTEPPIDEASAKRIANEAAEAALEKARAAEEAAKPRTPEEDAYAQWEKQLWEKENRQPTYLEALTFVKEQAKQELKAEQDTAAQQQAEQQRVASEQKAAEQKQLDTIIDDELNDLYTAGELTRIKDPNNPSDQGVVERQALFTHWAAVNAERRSKGLPDVLSAARIYHYHGFVKPNAQPAGSDAPVQGNRGTATPPSAQDEYSYQDLKKPWSFFRRS